MISLWFLKGREAFPWHAECEAEPQDVAAIIHAKDRAIGYELFEGVPAVFCDFYEYTRNISPHSSTRPDYAYWLRKFQDAYTNSGEIDV